MKDVLFAHQDVSVDVFLVYEGRQAMVISKAHIVLHKAKLIFLLLVVGLLVGLPGLPGVEAYNKVGRTAATGAARRTVTQWKKQLDEGYQRRVAADPSFPQKSLTEVLLAAGTQLAAEWTRRGAHRLLPEADFVVPAILTAVFGKYYR